MLVDPHTAGTLVVNPTGTYMCVYIYICWCASQLQTNLPFSPPPPFSNPNPVVESWLLAGHHPSANKHSMERYRQCLLACFEPQELQEYVCVCVCVCVRVCVPCCLPITPPSLTPPNASTTAGTSKKSTTQPIAQPAGARAQARAARVCPARQAADKAPTPCRRSWT